MCEVPDPLAGCAHPLQRGTVRPVDDRLSCRVAAGQVPQVGQDEDPHPPARAGEVLELAADLDGGPGRAVPVPHGRGAGVPGAVVAVVRPDIRPAQHGARAGARSQGRPPPPMPPPAPAFSEPKTHTSAADDAATPKGWKPAEPGIVSLPQAVPFQCRTSGRVAPLRELVTPTAQAAPRLIATTLDSGSALAECDR